MYVLLLWLTVPDALLYREWAHHLALSAFASVVLGAAHASCVETTVSAHVIVAADGTHSRARQALLSPLQSWHTQDTVLPVSTEDAESGLLLPHELRSARADAWDVHGAHGLHQTSLLLRLAPLHGGGCPPKRAYGVNGKVRKQAADWVALASFHMIIIPSWRRLRVLSMRRSPSQMLFRWFSSVSSAPRVNFRFVCELRVCVCVC